MTRRAGSLVYVAKCFLLTASNEFVRAEPIPRFASKPGEGWGEHPPLTFRKRVHKLPGWNSRVGACLLQGDAAGRHGAGSLPSAAWEEHQLLPVPFVPLLPWDKRKGTRLHLHPVPWGDWHTIHLPLPLTVKCLGTQQHLTWSPGPPVMGLGAWTAFPFDFGRQICSSGYAMGWWQEQDVFCSPPWVRERCGSGWCRISVLPFPQHSSWCHRR